MKALNHLLVTTAAVAALNSALATRADGPLLSPRASVNQIFLVAGSANDPDLLQDRPIGNARAWALAQDFRTVAGAGSNIDLVHGPTPLLSPKDPRYEQVAKALGQSQYQIAPLK